LEEFMKSRAVRLTLFCLFAIAVGVGAYIFWTNEMRVRAQAGATRDFSGGALAAIVQVHELRSAQQGYVAAGQGEDFWAEKVSSGITAVGDAVNTLRSQAVSPAAQGALESATQSLQAFGQMDRRAREYARGGQKLLASDLIYADGLEVTAAAAASIEEARQAESSAGDRTIADARLQQAAAAGGVAVLGLLLTALLAPRTSTVTTDSVVAPAVAPAAPETADLAALDAGWNAKSASSKKSRRLDLAPIASLCTDLARVVDTQSLPALLERAATALDASGIVVWIADPDGRELMPVLTHGYAPTVVTRLGTILRDAENATASAFRTGLLQTVKTDAMSHGAIAAPLVTPGGCVGVMAAEVRNEGEQDETKRAAAAIVAAQLATLVGPPSARNHSKAEAAG
jgi:hypothetical protein